MKRCICVYQRDHGSWQLRLIHWRCPRHGYGDHWQAP